MRNHCRSILLLICLTVLCASIKGQTAENESYFLQHNLIFFSDKTPEVSSDNIIFTNESICGFNPKVYESRILNRDEKIKIVSIDKNSDLAKVTFEAREKRYEILLKNLSKKEFNKSFSLVFSKEVSVIKDEEVKSWKQAVKQFGFPIARCESGSKGWFYILEFSPTACGSFDGCVIQVTKKGISISGYI